MKLNEAITLREARGIVVFHGDNYNTTRLSPSLMNNGNNQEGIGIYFSDNPETAEFYGSNTIKAYVDTSRLVDSRESMDVVGRWDVLSILKDMAREDEEEMFYLLTDYGVFLQEPEDMVESHIEEVVPMLMNEEVRNFQITMAQTFGVEAFVASWNRNTDIDGAYHQQFGGDTWIAIINPNIRVEKV